MPEASPAAPPRRAARFGWTLAAVVLTAFAIVAIAEHADRPARRSPHHQSRPRRCRPIPRFSGVTNWPLVTSVTSVVLTVAFFGYLAWQSIREPQPTLAADRRDRRLLRRRAGPAGELGDVHGLRSAGRALPAVLALLQRLTASGTDAVISRRLRELLRADRARPALHPSAVHRTAYPSQRLARPAPVRRRLHHRIHCGSSAQRAHAVHVVEGRVCSSTPRRRAPCCISFGRQLPLYMVIYDSVLFAIVALLCVRDDNGRPAIRPRLAHSLPGLGRDGSPPRD